MAWSKIETASIPGADGGQVEVEMLENQRIAAGAGALKLVEQGIMASVSRESGQLFEVVAWVPIGRRYDARKLVKDHVAQLVQEGKWESGKSYSLEIK
ncbi:MAG: hypothetical protein EXR50_04585 [Dehalococcoidia bacterium]|nr:hypothetical protein [Dehalococcoidia bacterium]